MSNQTTNTEWNAQVIYARRAVLAAFLLDWSWTHEGFSREERGRIDQTETALRCSPSPRTQFAALIRLGRTWADTGEPLSDDEKTLVRQAAERLQDLDRILPLAA